MPESRRRAPWRRTGWVAVLLGLFGAPVLADEEHGPKPSSPVAAAMAGRAEAIAHTLELLGERRAEQAALVARRVRALHKLIRGGHGPLWFEPAARGALVRHRAVARVVGRDVHELALIDGEARAARRAATAVAAAASAPVGAAPGPASLVRPVPGAIVGGFGAYRDRDVELSRRGVELAAEPGGPVRAPAGGRVAFAGALRGLDQVVVVDHGGYWTVLGGLASVEVGRGDPVAAGTVLASAAGRRIALEVRLRGADPTGHPVDPRPLLIP